jgi:hypothetical protein
MQQRFVVLPDGKGGQHIVEQGFGTPMPQPAPAMVPAARTTRRGWARSSGARNLIVGICRASRLAIARP